MVGSGEKLDRPLPQATREWLTKQGIAVEQMDTVRFFFCFIASSPSFFLRGACNPIISPTQPPSLSPYTHTHKTHRHRQLTNQTQSSACATFNILNQEDRRVVGALLAVDEEEPPPPPTPAAPAPQ